MFTTPSGVAVNSALDTWHSLLTLLSKCFPSLLSICTFLAGPLANSGGFSAELMNIGHNHDMSIVE